MLQEAQIEIDNGHFQNRYYKHISREGGKFKMSMAKDHPTQFMKFLVGFTPRDYQHLLFDKILDNQKIAIVKGRQIGFTTSIAAFCLWAAWYNMYPSSKDKITQICVISKDDDAAKALLQQVKDFMYMGDRHMAGLLKGKHEHTGSYFSQHIKTNNVDQLKFINGCKIFSFPPTAKVRGTSNSILFIDEFAFLNNTNHNKFFYTDALPSISETGGKVIISSTPNGFGNLFHTLIDPEEIQDKHAFYRITFPYTVNKASPTYLDNVKILQQHMTKSDFAQEYLCAYTQAEANFFDSLKVKDMSSSEAETIDLTGLDVIAAIDYGMTVARTVITLCVEVDNVIYRVYYKEFEAGWDTNGLIPFMEGLLDRYNITKVVVDDCAQGNTLNNKMASIGWPIDLFDFHTKKLPNYVAFKGRMNKGEIKCNLDSETELQFMEMIQEESKTGKLKIHKTSTGRDDIVDSFIMAAYPFLETREKIGAWLI